MPVNQGQYPRGGAVDSDPHHFSSIRRIRTSFDPESAGPATVTIMTVPVPGVKVGDVVLSIEVPAGVGSLALGQCEVVSVPDQVEMYVINVTAAPIDLTLRDFDFVVATVEDVAGVVEAALSVS